MIIEQEGIELETINSNNDEINIPDVEEVEGTQDVPDTTEISGNNSQNTNTSDDEEKASLKRGLNKERALRKAAEKKNKEFEARLEALEKANKESEKSAYDTLIEGGLDEEVAKSVSKAIDSQKTDTSKLEKEVADLKFEKSLNALSKEEEFADIEDYADEIKDLVDKGLTIEQSYHAIAYDKPHTQNTKSEMQRKLEVKMQNNNARKEILQNTNNNSGVAQNSKKININATEKALAAAAGMTAEEYATMRDIDNVKQYDEYKSRKK